VKAGDYYVSETPNPPTANYTTSVACVNAKNTPATNVTVGSDGKVHVNVGDTVVCTYPNTYVKTKPNIATTLKNASGGATIANGTHLPLGSGVFDTAQITNTGGFALTGTVTFKFFNTIDCTGSATTYAGVAT